MTKAKRRGGRSKPESALEDVTAVKPIRDGDHPVLPIRGRSADRFPTIEERLRSPTNDI